MLSKALNSMLLTACVLLASCAADPAPSANGSDPSAAATPKLRISDAQPLAFAETFTIDSTIMGESRRINVMVPTIYGQAIDTPMPVLYMLDGGLAEDFQHVAGLVQVLVCNGTMRPFILVGIENTQRRRDLTGPSSIARDLKIAPVVGRSATFRRFIRDELMPAVRARYRTTDETAIVGESLAGLFIVETLFEEPGLFDTAIAIDPSVWWNDAKLVKTAAAGGGAGTLRGKLFLASSDEPELATLTGELHAALAAQGANSQFEVRYLPLTSETHATIYHPAALIAFRAMLGPAPDAAK